MTGKPLAELRIWAVYSVLCWLVCCTACTSAVANIIACRPAALRGITFERVPTDIGAPVIVDATILDQTEVSDASGRRMILMNARIDRVIKGEIDTRDLKIVAYAGGCGRAGVGQGIILGTLRNDPLRGVMLEAIQGANMLAWSREFSQKQMSLWNSAMCVKNEFGVRACRLPAP